MHYSFLRKKIVDGLAWQSFDDALSTLEEQGNGSFVDLCV
jgi:hypothetical protein